jgi:ubiquinone/menaquinone biosynthesis C-methylase UbiE
VVARPVTGPSATSASEVEVGRRLFGHALERRVFELLAVGPGETVLELASGAGALCLRLAEIVRPGGRTICSDLQPERVEATRRRAVADDVDVRILDMLRLDLPDASVDGVLCRWGFMFPVPAARAFEEAYRVLRRGRRLVLAVWADPRRNPWITLVDEAVLATGHDLAVDRREPGRMFSLADPGRLEVLLSSAGFEAITVEEVGLAWEYDDFGAYWDEEALIPGPFQDFFAALPKPELAAIQEHLKVSMKPYAHVRGGYRIPGITLVATGRRPDG